MEHQLQQFAYRVQVPVRWADMDSMGHVNNAKFFTYAESSRIAYFDSLLAGETDSVDFILAHIGCDFISQVHYPATLEVGCRITRIGRSSLEVLSVLFQNEAPVAVVKGVLVWFDYARQQSTRVPESVRARIKAREVVAPDEAAG